MANAEQKSKVKGALAKGLIKKINNLFMKTMIVRSETVSTLRPADFSTLKPADFSTGNL